MHGIIPSSPHSFRGSFRERMLSLVDEHERLQHAYSLMARSGSAEALQVRVDDDDLSVHSDTEQQDSKDSVSMWTGEAAVLRERTKFDEETHEVSSCISDNRWITSYDLEQRLQQASQKGYLPDIIRILEQRGDPNCMFNSIRVKKKEILSGGPLAIACLRGDDLAMVALLERRASPDAQYTCVVGASRSEVSFPVAHAIVRRGSIEMLHTLMSFNADIHAKTSLGGNLLWEASHTDNYDAAQFLIECGVSIDECAQSQDDCTNWYTPLHTSCLQGHASLVDMLLRSKASVNGKNEGICSILEDVISAGHAVVVRKLVANGAQLFEGYERTLSDRSGINKSFSNWSVRRRGRDGARGIDHLFEVGDDVVVASAALGLKRVMSEELDKLTIDDFVDFLNRPGDAPGFFLEAIMRPHRISYWDENTTRVHLSVGFIPIREERNIGVGPHAKELRERYGRRQILDSSTRSFIDALTGAPGNNSGFRCCASQRRFVPGIFRMCHIAGVVDEPRVINALANCPLRIFRIPSTQVIVEAQWRKVKNTAQLLTLWSVLYMLTFMFINYVLIMGSPTAVNRITVLGLGVWLSELAIKLVIVMGIFTHGAMLQTSEILQLMEVAMSGALLSSVLISKGEVKQYTVFNTAIGVTVFVRWTKVLWELTAMRAIGLRVLPILIALQQIGSFCGVLFAFLLATTNMYFALNYQPALDKCFMIIFKIVLLGEMDMDEVMNDKKIGTIKDDAMYEEHPENNFEYAVVRTFVCCVSFFMGTAMMNIFIAVLSRCFEDAANHRLSLFLHRRTRITQTHLIMKNRLAALMPKIFRRKRSSSFRDDEEDEESLAMPYLWDFTPTGHDEEGEAFEQVTMDSQRTSSGFDPSSMYSYSARLSEGPSKGTMTTTPKDEVSGVFTFSSYQSRKTLHASSINDDSTKIGNGLIGL